MIDLAAILNYDLAGSEGLSPWGGGGGYSHNT